MNPMATANVTQTTSGAVKSDWVIRANGEDGEELGRLPGNLGEAHVFEILHLARKYELLAFNAGIDFQKDKQNQFLKDEIARLRFEQEAILAHNATLADTLERLTNGETNGDPATD
jgi:hypothetical protein